MLANANNDKDSKPFVVQRQDVLQDTTIWRAQMPVPKNTKNESHVCSRANSVAGRNNMETAHANVNDDKDDIQRVMCFSMAVHVAGHNHLNSTHAYPDNVKEISHVFSRACICCRTQLYGERACQSETCPRTRAMSFSRAT